MFQSSTVLSRSRVPSFRGDSSSMMFSDPLKGRGEAPRGGHKAREHLSKDTWHILPSVPMPPLECYVQGLGPNLYKPNPEIRPWLPVNTWCHLQPGKTQLFQHHFALSHLTPKFRVCVCEMQVTRRFHVMYGSPRELQACAGTMAPFHILHNFLWAGQ